MSKNLLNKYVWLVETIYKAKRITFEEISEKWLDNKELSEGVDLPLRTFHKWRIAAEEMFGLIIDCERKGGYHYYIQNAEDIKRGSIRSWLLSTISVSNLLIENQHLKDRILLESIPSGQEYLSSIIEAIKSNVTLSMTYQSYWRDASNTFEVEPYCVKLFKQRWYLLARSPYYDDLLIYALDRILDLEILYDQPFKMPKSFSPSEFFNEYYGVIVGVNTPLEKVRLKVSAGQSNYFRSLPLHHTQQETFTTGDYSIFEFQLRPTFDFQQEILWNGDSVEVLEPIWLRQELSKKINCMQDKYKEE
ncbi:MAG: WYL domain-containing protein [Bacteroidaceae bacterium]|nr:WYL domain-containing protein [Bacteroidaceae bacterium]